MPIWLTILLTFIGVILGIPIGGYWARKTVVPFEWTLDDEIKWWLGLLFK